MIPDNDNANEVSCYGQGAIEMSIVRAAVAWILAFACAPSSEAGERDAVSTWTRWEHVLTAAGDYPNPYASPTVAVTYRGPGGESIKGYGFWDGAKVFLAELRSLPAFSPCAHGIDTGERLAGLAALVACARAPFEFVLRTLDAMGGSKPASPQAQDFLAQVPFDWNEPLKDFNRTVSALVQAARAERYSERAEESARYERQLEARVDGVSAELEALKSRGDWRSIKKPEGASR